MGGAMGGATGRRFAIMAVASLALASGCFRWTPVSAETLHERPESLAGGTLRVTGPAEAHEVEDSRVAYPFVEGHRPMDHAAVRLDLRDWVRVERREVNAEATGGFLVGGIFAVVFLLVYPVAACATSPCRLFPSL